MPRRFKLTVAGWVGLVLAIVVGGALDIGLAFPAGVAWIFLCLFDPKRGGW